MGENLKAVSLAVLMWMVGVIGGMLLGSLAEAQPPTTDLCWRLAPFDDTLRVAVLQPVPDVENFFEMPDVVWDGAGIYAVMGGGTAIGRSALDSFVMDVTLHHSTTFFGGNPLCNFTARVIYPELTGQWGMVCERSSTTKPSFYTAGTMVPVSCEAEPFADKAFGVRSVGRLAGVDSL